MLYSTPYGPRAPGLGLTEAAIGSIFLSEGGIIKAEGVIVTNGTTITGDVDDTKQINQVYLQVQETGQYQIDFTFIGLLNDPAQMSFTGRYGGIVGHDNFVWGWNYNLLQWERLTTAADDIPFSAEDNTLAILFPNDSSDYVSEGVCQVRIEHSGATTPGHMIYVDEVVVLVKSIIFPTPGDHVFFAGGQDGIERNTVVNGAAGTIGILKTGTYDFAGRFSMVGTPSAFFHGHVFVNGLEEESIAGAAQMDTAGTIRTVSMGGPIELVEGDIVKIGIQCLTENGWMAVEYANISLILEANG